MDPILGPYNSPRFLTSQSPPSHQEDLKISPRGHEKINPCVSRGFGVPERLRLSNFLTDLWEVKLFMKGFQSG